MDYLTNRATVIKKRLAHAQERVALAQEDVDTLTRQLDDIIQSQDWLSAQTQIGQDVQQHSSQATKRPDHLPSKAYLLINPTDSKVMAPTLDPRFDQVRGSPVRGRAFSKNLLRIVFFTPGEYPLRHFTLRHPEAATCPIKLCCEHWRLVEENISQTRGKWDIDIRCTAIRADFDASGSCGVSMIDEDEAESERISPLTCRIFDYLQPDFGAIEQRGYEVLDWHMYEPDKAGYGGDKINRLKLMDQFGRRIFENLEQAYP
ncbi:hypothetical protein FCIRC_5883 [Fusarium circinatum]|uniref:Uncharacterized protein n=1 Tax=Fusarium circinatum TaxID=48490 RepID=A0A8H5U342_FUSCI|nr:hypothetical protein FCIRC_5883 [Fusarium circinatum]